VIGRVPLAIARVILAVALLVAGCGGSSRPFDRVDLIPSYWDVVRVAGADVTGAPLPVLTIGRSSSGRVALACGEIDLSYVADTDGSALSFAEQRVAAGCAASLQAQDAAIRAAVGNVRSWRVDSETDIEMLDAAGQSVLSLRLTDCDCPHQPPGMGGPTSS
jgi:hypothetical protein